MNCPFILRERHLVAQSVRMDLEHQIFPHHRMYTKSVPLTSGVASSVYGVADDSI